MISALVIVKNEEQMIEGCLSQLAWCDEIIVINNNSSDKTAEISKKFTKNVFDYKELNFSKVRNFASNKANGDWLLYIDADERLDSGLVEEIKKSLTSAEFSAFAIPRKNIMFGKFVRYGGWYPDYQIRLFKKTKLKTWQGNLHETPNIMGNIGKLNNSIIHYTHRTIRETLNKKLEWSGIEAQERFDTNHPHVTWPRIVKVMLFEFIRRYFLMSGWRDGAVGFITAADESFSMFVIYSRLWEMQNNEKNSNL